MDDMRILYVDQLGNPPPYDIEIQDPNYNDPQNEGVHTDPDSFEVSKESIIVPSEKEGSRMEPGTGCLGSIKSRIHAISFNPSIPCFSITLSVVPLIITAIAILLAMSNLYSKAIDEFAENSASSLTITTATNVVAQLEEPSDAIDSLQYQVQMLNPQLPTVQEAERLKALAELEDLGAAQNLSSQFVNATRNLITSQYDQTTELIRTSFLGAMRQSGNKCPTIMVAWKDGSYMSAECPANSDDTYNFARMLPNASNPHSPMATLTFEVDRLTGRNISVVQQTSAPFSPTDSDWWLSTRTPLAKVWSAMSIVRRPVRPVVLLTGALFSKKNSFLGVAGYFFSLEQLTTLLQNTPRQSGSEIYILSTGGRVIGSSSGKLSYTAEEYYPASPGNPLSQDDIVINMCSYVSETHTKYCLRSIDDFGDGHLIEARNKLSDKIFFANTADEASQRPTKSFLDGGKPNLAKYTSDKGHATYVSWLPLSLTNAALKPWSLVVILPANRLTEVRHESLKWSVIIAILLIVAIAIAVAVFARRVLRPLAIIVKLMTYSAYLHDSNGEESTEGGSERRNAPRLTEEMRLQLADRTLSRWSEVKGIQKAYWSMSEELQALKAYIPEHLRDEVMAMHKEKNTTKVLTISPIKTLTRQIEAIKLLGGDVVFSLQNSAKDMSFTDLKCDIFSDGAGSGSKDQGGTSSGSGTLSGRENDSSFVNTVSDAVSIAYTQESFEDASVAAARAAVPANSHEHPIFFADNVLVDRDITMVHLNIVNFHYYARSHPGVTVSRDYEEFITFIYKEARRHGGILENFSGDKVWVSFNASSKCVNGPIAAAYFAYHVTSCINSAVIAKASLQVSMPQAPNQEPPTSISCSLAHYFAVAPYGITGGVATGRAFVGPLGNAAIKRHSIISNAMSEAAALERQALRYPGCNVLVGGDMIPAIEGYCQYILIDTTYLPGSDAKRRRIACLKGPMVDPKCEMEVVRRWLPPAEVVSTSNRFKTINEAMNAFLEGQYEVCRTLMNTAVNEAANFPVDAPRELGEYKASVDVMCDLLSSFIESNVDGRTYRSPLGDFHAPSIHTLAFC